MPIYEYECGACGDRHEFIQKFSDAPKRKCPACGASRLKRLVSAAAFHLKGSGWYVTDFRDKGKKKPDGKEAKDGNGAAATSSSTDKAKDGATDKAKGGEKGADKSPAKSTDTSTKTADSGKKSGATKSAD